MLIPLFDKLLIIISFHVLQGESDDSMEVRWFGAEEKSCIGAWKLTYNRRFDKTRSRKHLQTAGILHTLVCSV